jgi:hypothetical protein
LCGSARLDGGQSGKLVNMISSENPYFKKMVAWVNSYEEGLWDNLERVHHLEPQVGQALLSGFPELACQCQNIGNIMSGRQGILSLPRAWILEHIEDLAEPLLQLEDDYEWWRLLEVYDALDKQMAKRLALRAANHPNHTIKEAGESYLEA